MALSISPLPANGPLNDLISNLRPGGAFREAESWSYPMEKQYRERSEPKLNQNCSGFNYHG